MNDTVNKIMALAGQLATARTRRALVARGLGSPSETEEGTKRRVKRITDQLREAVEAAVGEKKEG